MCSIFVVECQKVEATSMLILLRHFKFLTKIFSILLSSLVNFYSRNFSLKIHIMLEICFMVLPDRNGQI